MTNYAQDSTVDAAQDHLNRGYTLSASRQEMERSYVEAVLERCQGVVVAAAKMAGVEPSNMHRLIRKHGIGRTR